MPNTDRISFNYRDMIRWRLMSKKYTVLSSFLTLVKFIQYYNLQIDSDLNVWHAV